MEGDVEGVVARPDPEGEEQDKWDAWGKHHGLSKTAAKRCYIELLIDTMHNHTSETPDARELVSELEFVWDQIKNNSPAATSSSSASYGLHSSYGLQSPPMQGPGAYPASPLPTPGLVPHQAQGGLLEVDPVSQDQALVEEERRVALTAGLRSPEMEQELFVDASDSLDNEDEARSAEVSPLGLVRVEVQGSNSAGQISEDPVPMPLSDQSNQQLDIGMSSLQPDIASEAGPRPAQSVQFSQTPAPISPTLPQPRRSPGMSLLPSFAKYLPSRASAPAPEGTADQSTSAAALAAQAKWQRRIETSLVRMTTEVAALREQLEHQQNNYSFGALHPLRQSISGGVSGPGKLSMGSVLTMLGRWFLSYLLGVLRHLVVDGAVILAVWLYLRKRRGWDDDKIAREVVKLVVTVAALFGPVAGAWEGFRSRMPRFAMPFPQLANFAAWLRSWGQMLFSRRRASIDEKRPARPTG